jgi:aryl-alcohol dehydrogenase-like predicted oxidoreductase
MLTRQLRASGPRMSVIGLGCMGMSDLYGPADVTESIAMTHAALDAGITLLDGAVRLSFRWSAHGGETG